MADAMYRLFDDLRWLDAQLTINFACMQTLKVFKIDPEVVL